MVQNKLPLINSAHGSDTRNIINELIKLFNGMGYTYDEALTKAHNVLEEARKTNNVNENVQQQINTLIAESGTSDAEVLQARIDEEGNEYTVLKERLDVEKKESEKETETVKNTLTTKALKKRPIVSFVDDDGRNALYDYFKPIFESRNVPCATAVITNRYEEGYTGDYFSLEKLRELDALGWEVMGHSYSHPTGQSGLMEFSGDYETLEFEIGEGCKGFLEKEGFEVDGFVYPQGGSDYEIREITKNHYLYALGGNGINDNATPNRGNINALDTMQVERIAFGSFTNTNPEINGNDEKNTLNYYKACVDHAIEHNGWLVFMTHAAAQDRTEDAVLEQLLDYIISLGVDIVNPREAHNMHGNKFFAGDVREGKYTIIDKEGDLVTSSPTLIKLEDNSRTHADTIHSYPFNKVSIMRVQGQNEFPGNSSGFLKTYHLHESDFQDQKTYNFQEYIPRWSSKVYRRFVDIDSRNQVWREWNEDEVTNVITLPTNTFTASNTISEYPESEIILYNVTNTGGASFPTGGAGSIITYRTGGPSYDFQIFKPAIKNNEYRRHVTSSGAWSNWEGGSRTVKISVPAFANIPARGHARNKVTLTGVTPTGTSVSGTPEWGAAPSILYRISVTAADEISIDVYNFSDSDASLSARNWIINIAEI